VLNTSDPTNVIFSGGAAPPPSGIFTAAIRLTKAGNVTLEASIDGTQTSGSGQVLLVKPAPAHAQNCIFSLLSGKIVAGENITIVGQAYDAFHNRLETGGSLFQCATALLKMLHSDGLRSPGECAENADTSLILMHMFLQIQNHQHAHHGSIFAHFN
jgi:hypothetical protein